MANPPPVPRKILLVEDNVDVARFLRRTLEGPEIEVLTAADGIEALERVAAERPSLILADLELPRMGGLEMIRKLKEDRRSASIPVIVLTGHASPETIREAAEAEAVDFLTKGHFVPQEAIRRIRAALGLPPASGASGRPTDLDRLPPDA
jgi:CheY-like chemotaxis protein